MAHSLRVLAMFTARLWPCLPVRTRSSCSRCCSHVCWFCLCAIFGAFPADLCKTVAFFNCIFHRSAVLVVVDATSHLPPPFSHSLRACSFASFTRFVPFVRSSFRSLSSPVCANVFYAIFTHLRNFAFKCATHCHAYCCSCSCVVSLCPATVFRWLLLLLPAGL